MIQRHDTVIGLKSSVKDCSGYGVHRERATTKQRMCKLILCSPGMVIGL